MKPRAERENKELMNSKKINKEQGTKKKAQRTNIWTV